MVCKEEKAAVRGIGTEELIFVVSSSAQVNGPLRAGGSVSAAKCVVAPVGLR